MNIEIRRHKYIFERKSKFYFITLFLITFLLISLITGFSTLTSVYTQLLFILIYSVAIFENKFNISKFQIYYLLIYALLNCFGVIATGRAELGYILSEVIVIVLYFIMIPSLINNKELITMFKFIVIISIFIIVLKDAPIELENSYIFNNKNSWAQTMMFAALTSFYLYSFNKKIIYLICSFIFFFSVFTSFSRTAIVTCIIFLFLYFLLSSNKGVKAKLPLIIMLIFLIYIVMFTDAASYIGDFLQINSNDPFTNRDTLWEIGIQTFMGNPIFGAGRGTAEQYLSFYDLREYHSYYVEVLATRGIVNFVFFLIISFRSFKLSINVYKKNRTIGSVYLSAFIAIYIYMLAESFAPYAFSYNSCICALLIYISPLIINNTNLLNNQGTVKKISKFKFDK